MANVDDLYHSSYASAPRARMWMTHISITIYQIQPIDVQIGVALKNCEQELNRDKNLDTLHDQQAWL